MNTVNRLKEIIQNFEKLQERRSLIEKAAAMMIDALTDKKKIIFCGNGGSASDAQHLSAELVGRYKFDRPALAALSLATDTSAMTAIGNDYGYEEIFSRQLRGLGVLGDVLVGISTSGNSPNVVNAFKVAKSMQIKTIAFTGDSGGKMRETADLTLNVPSSITNNIQEMHIACGHIICELIENHFFKK